MAINKSTVKLFKSTTILCFALWLSGCVLPIKQTVAPIPDDAPLSQFILGKWHSVDVNSGEFNDDYEKEFLLRFENDQIYLTVIYSDSNTEGYNFEYNFTDQDTVYVNNIRITGGENWQLEKSIGKGSVHLIVTRHITILRMKLCK